ncbi:GNAT family N-acetyltransferase, partial [Thalassobaculum sp.]|uniref:GNAT family N-acetyltransferase n=1 Tax=Thalassobaculum sp. TaxID=2022740 RepID=UPI0032EEE78B
LAGGGRGAGGAADATRDRSGAPRAPAGPAGRGGPGHDDGFLGYAGVMPLEPGHPAGAAFDVGWRLVRAAWGRGFATEAAAAALHDAFARQGLPEVVAFTAPDNLRSQAVMQRLGMHRDPGRDFTAAWGGGDWHGLVWTARPTPATGA